MNLEVGECWARCIIMAIGQPWWALRTYTSNFQNIRRVIVSHPRQHDEMLKGEILQFPNYQERSSIMATGYYEGTNGVRASVPLRSWEWRLFQTLTRFQRLGYRQVLYHLTEPGLALVPGGRKTPHKSKVRIPGSLQLTLHCKVTVGVQGDRVQW